MSSSRPRTVAFLVVPPVQELDLVGPLEVFVSANRVMAERGPAYSLRIVSTDRTRAVAGQCGLSLVTEGNYRKLKGTVDTLFVGIRLNSVRRCPRRPVSTPPFAICKRGWLNTLAKTCESKRSRDVQP
jgi:transcriptional regulator GlxA family with amidase domain